MRDLGEDDGSSPRSALTRCRAASLDPLVLPSDVDGDCGGDADSAAAVAGAVGVVSGMLIDEADGLRDFVDGFCSEASSITIVSEGDDATASATSARSGEAGVFVAVESASVSRVGIEDGGTVLLPLRDRWPASLPRLFRGLSADDNFRAGELSVEPVDVAAATVALTLSCFLELLSFERDELDLERSELGVDAASADGERVITIVSEFADSF